MAADRIHLVRHGEVHNPQGVLYGRLPNFGLSKLGHKMAQQAALELQNSGRKVVALYCSPLQRTRESSQPFQEAFGLTPVIDDRLIEPHNIFEGKVISGGRILLKPHLWFHLRNPSKPSWGEPYQQIASRMTEAIFAAADSVESGDLVIVSHQLPIWMVHSWASDQPLPHNPTQRRCALSSITSFEIQDGKLVEVDYKDPAALLRAQAKDVGAV
jgi:broad specificity phosphatase PhoE